MRTALSDRVSQSLSEKVNDRVKSRIQSDIDYHREHPEEIDKKIEELGKTWSLERILQTNASILVLAGALLGAFRHRRWLFLSGIPGIFLLLHGLTGWAPPVEGMRRMGLRTFREIDEERCELKSIKG